MTHNLSVVEYVSDRVVVMYLGKIVEVASTSDLYRNTLHPYSRALMSAIPTPDPRRSSSASRSCCGARFRARSTRLPAVAFTLVVPPISRRAREVEPELREIQPGDFTACHLYASTPTLATTASGADS